jgi:transposase
LEPVSNEIKDLRAGSVELKLPARIRAHAAICFMALILYRVMRLRLRAGDTQFSPERALAKLRRIQHHQVIVNDTQSVTGLSTISQEHTAILAALPGSTAIQPKVPQPPMKSTI